MAVYARGERDGGREGGVHCHACGVTPCSSGAGQVTQPPSARVSPAASASAACMNVAAPATSTPQLSHTAQ
eukprot:954630-Rhodomonas_salina.1